METCLRSSDVSAVGWWGRGTEKEQNVRVGGVRDKEELRFEKSLES